MLFLGKWLFWKDFRMDVFDALEIEKSSQLPAGSVSFSYGQAVLVFGFLQGSPRKGSRGFGSIRAHIARGADQLLGPMLLATSQS